MDRVAAIKMVILPRFLFHFQNLLVEISNSQLHQVERMINKCLWSGKKSRIKFSVLQQNVSKGGLGLPNFRYYYHAAQLVTLLQWWLPQARINWAGEQNGIPLLCQSGFY